MATPPLILYSCITSFAYNLGEKFYNSLHYVWCSPFFDESNPASSTPKQIYNQYMVGIESEDRHSHMIERNKTALRMGVKAKCDAGVLSPQTRDDLLDEILRAERSEFKPVILVIPYQLVKDRIVPVPLSQRANTFSEEILIQELPRTHFDVIKL